MFSTYFPLLSYFKHNNQDIPSATRRNLPPPVKSIPTARLGSQQAPSETSEAAFTRLRGLVNRPDDNDQDMNNMDERDRTRSAESSQRASAPARVLQTRRRPRVRRECVACGGRPSPFRRFPSHKITSKCQHPGSTCKSCLRKWMTAQLDSTTWDQIRCPECTEVLEHNDIRIHANPSLFRWYVTHSSITWRALANNE
jgi:hypothetical protein